MEAMASGLLRFRVFPFVERKLGSDCIHRCQPTHSPATNIFQERCIVHQTRNIVTFKATTHRHVHQSILHRINPKHLYQIINDVDQYQNFLPYCQESKILQKSPCGTMYDAVLRVGLPGLSKLSSSSLMEERYISRVRMMPPSDANRPMWTVEAKSIQSQLFDSLKSRWQLSIAEHDYENDDLSKALVNSSCNVNFEVEIQVSNPLISVTLDQMLKDVAKKQVEAFERRCREVPFDNS
ncbi:hypothetical protein ACHAXR_005445 [Thalassiosira sp. AJA248-18]